MINKSLIKKGEYLRSKNITFLFFAYIICSPFILPSIVQCQESFSKKYAFVNVNLVSLKEENILYDQTVVVVNGIINRIVDSDSSEIPEGAFIIQGKDKYLVPGLVDAHVHMRQASKKALIEYLQAGITTIRDMNGRPFLLEWRDSVRIGKLLGPTMYVASPTIGNFSSPREGYPTPKTTEEADSLVKAFKKQGYDWIKTYSFVPRDIYLALIDAAEKYEMPIGGHPSIYINFEEALKLDSIEHLLGYVEPIMTEKARKLDEKDFRAVFHAVEIDEEKLPELARKMEAAGVYNCPTILFFDHRVPTERVRKAWEKSELRKLGHENRIKIVRALHKVGAPLVLCTDSDAGRDLPANAIFEEIENMHKAGLSTIEVLKAGTANASNLLGSSKFGTISVGKRADLLLLEGNPLKDLTFLKKKIGVMVQGHWITEHEFEILLQKD